jgi:uncharacterized membrane protein YbhN (UPF0104 family)
VNKKLRFLGTFVLITWLVTRTNLEQIKQVTHGLRLGFWLTAVGLYVVIQGISGFRWQLLAKPFGFNNSLGQYINFYFIGMFFNLFLPTSVGGDVVRAWYLDGGSGQKARALITVLVDRLSGLIVLLFLACVGVVWCPIHLENWILAGVWCSAGIALVGFLLAPLLIGKFERFEKLQSLADLLRVYRQRPLLMSSATLISLIIQAGNIVLVWLVGLAIGAQIPWPYYWIMVPMVTLLTMLPISLNGMGVREGATILYLAPLGISQETALSLAVLWFAVFTTASLIGGLLYLWGGYARPATSSKLKLEWKAAA